MQWNRGITYAASCFSQVKIFLHAPVMNVSFGALTFSAVEGNSVELVLMKTAGAIGPVSVNLFTVDDTAKGYCHLMCTHMCMVTS